MKKRPYKEWRDLIEQTHPAEGQNNYQNYHPSDSHKMIDTKEEEDFLEDSPEEDSLEGEDSPEGDASLEEEDTQEEGGCHLEDHPEAVGDHCRFPCHRPIKGSWWENHPRSTTVTGKRQLSSSMNGSYIGQLTTIMPL